MMTPEDSINANPPNVWITYFDGFDPGTWGFTGFTQESTRTSFVKRSEPGVLVVIAGSSRAEPAERQRVIGLLQCSHELGRDRDYMPSAAFADKEGAERSAGKWSHAVRVVRAWLILPHNRPLIEDFASETYTPGRAQVIGAQGMPLTADEARGILSLDLEEVDVFNQPPVDGTRGPAEEALRPSRPGPTSQSPTEHKEAEGPCHVYVLTLSGKPGIFLNDPSARGKIVKVGFSKAPEDRREAHNRHIPVGPFQWNVLKSTEAEGRSAFLGSIQGKAAEAAMIAVLDRDGRSLGREFFLSEDGVIEEAWKAALKAGDEA
ncbi:hypothetical protein [Roseovarius sp. D0-M9]|uniref:hypothetical protein n=1 Tax=Roseovarius sp. D0-M9 TaxID=3127117 RepID=UPI00301021CF